MKLIHIIIISSLFMSLRLFSGENETADLFKSESRDLMWSVTKAKMTFDEFSKTYNANQLAMITIKDYSGSLSVQKEFIDYMLTKAPEKIRILYAIQIMSEPNFYPSSSGYKEMFEGYCIALWRQRIAQIDKQSTNKKMENKAQ